MPEPGVAHNAKTRGSLSILSSGLYFIPAGILLFDHPIAAAAFCLLAAGTLLFHATDKDYGLDAAGMLAATAVLVGIHFGWLAELAAVAIGLALRQFYSHKLVAIFIVPVAGVCLLEGAWEWLLAGLALFGVGFWIWQRPGDWPHAAWHLATATAMTLIAIGLS